MKFAAIIAVLTSVTSLVLAEVETYASDTSVYVCTGAYFTGHCEMITPPRHNTKWDPFCITIHKYPSLQGLVNSIRPDAKSVCAFFTMPVCSHRTDPDNGFVVAYPGIANLSSTNVFDGKTSQTHDFANRITSWECRNKDDLPSPDPLPDWLSPAAIDALPFGSASSVGLAPLVVPAAPFEATTQMIHTGNMNVSLCTGANYTGRCVDISTPSPPFKPGRSPICVNVPSELKNSVNSIRIDADWCDLKALPCGNNRTADDALGARSPGVPDLSTTPCDCRANITYNLANKLASFTCWNFNM